MMLAKGWLFVGPTQRMSTKVNSWSAHLNWCPEPPWFAIQTIL